MCNKLTETIVVPFCWLPGSLGQAFDPETCSRTEFQVKYLKEISEKPEFAYFVTKVDGGDRYIIDSVTVYPGQPVVPWYDKNGRISTVVVGPEQAYPYEHADEISKISKPEPASLDSAVYKSRMPKDWEPVDLSTHPAGVYLIKHNDIVMVAGVACVANVDNSCGGPDDKIYLTTAATHHLPQGGMDDGGNWYPYHHVRDAAGRSERSLGDALMTRHSMVTMLSNGTYYIG